MTRSITVEGDLTTVDTATALTTQGSVTAPSVVVPAGVSKIDKIIVSVAAEIAGSGSAGYFLRLGGNAVKGGEQVISIAAQGGRVPVAVDTSGTWSGLFIVENVEIAVSSTDTIRIQGEMAGQDLGTARMVVTLIFA